VRSVAVALGAAVSVAALAYDPRALAADPKRALGLLLAVVILAAAVARPPRGVVRASPAALVFLAFVAWSGLTLAYGVPAGARDLGSWAAAAGLVLVTLPWPARRVRAAAGWAALFTGTAVSAVAVAQLARGARGLFVHGGQGNANWLGLILALAIPLTLDLAASRRRVAIALPLQLAGLVLSHSRVAWAACALTALPLLAALAWRKRGLAVIALALFTLAAAPPASSSEDVPISLAWQGRVWIWKTSAAAALAAAPAGAGLGGFAHAYLDAQGRRLAPLPPREASHRFVNATTAHCDWIEVLVDGGPVALILLALSVAWSALGAARAGWYGGAAALTAFAVCALGDSPLRQPGLVLLLGLVVSGAPRSLSLPRGPLALTVGRGVVLAACGLLLAGATRGWVAQRRLTAALAAAPEEQGALLASAARLDPTSGEIALERGLRALDLGHPDEASSELRRSRVLLANVGTDVALGNAALLLGDAEGSLGWYEAALARNPGSFRAHANISQPLVALGRLDEAERHLAIAAALWPGHLHLLEMKDQLQRARVERGAGP
jgi:tetratricopeptide (TPR) repeat protein